MNASQNCISLIKISEGFSAKPYPCPAGIPTIGYGSTRYADGAPVKLTDSPITENAAAAIVMATLNKEYVPAVSRYVTRPITQGQFDALVDFAYNAGVQNLRTSTLLKLVNAGDFKGAAKEFGKWTRGGGKMLPGLVKRREAERKLFEGIA